MVNYSKSVFSFLAVLSLVLGAPAAQAKGDPRENYPWWGFFGGGAGFSSLTENASSTQDKDGIQANLRAAVSWYLLDSNWVLEAGGGWLFNKMDRDLVGGGDRTVTTRAAFVDLAPRYRLDRNWQIGPVVQGLFGTDVSFSERTGSESVAVMAGIKGVYEFGVGELNRARLYLQAVTDLTISARQVSVFQAGFEFGLPFGDPTVRSKARKDRIKKKRASIRRRVRVVGKRAVQVTLGQEEGIFFETAKAALTPQTLEYVKAMGSFLKRHRKEWKTVRVEGHTDRRGGYRYNMNLSRSRALSVSKVFIAEGVPKRRIIAKGFGPDRPVDKRNTEKAWAKNRRVELRFDGVQNPEKFKGMIERVRVDLVDFIDFDD